MATELSGTVYPSNWKKRAFLESENDSIEPMASLGIAIDAQDKSKYPEADLFFKTLQNVAYACNCPDITITWYKDDGVLQ